jgi:glycosyltransferase involved in cell wall biosynthesis
MFGGFERIIAYGQLARSELVALGIADERIYVAQNTIDTGRIFAEAGLFAERAAALRQRHGLEDARVLLSIARFDPEKRLADLLAAWPALSTDPRLHLVLVGGGPLLEDIRSRAASLDPARIHVIGRAPVGEDYTWIAAADATIQCGAVGLAINQSMAFGTPTIIADEIGADTEILAHGETGWRYPRGDLDALARTVAAVFADPARTAGVNDAARTLLRDRVNIENMTEVMVRCILDALHSKVSQGS